MANIGTAHLLIVPKFNNLSGSISRALDGVDTSSVSGVISSGVATATSSGLSTGLSSAAVVVGNVVSGLISTGISELTSHVNSAVSRSDILNNYPKMMEAFNVETEEANASINYMSERLNNLPTTLDTMASTVQGLFAAGEKYNITLDTATRAGLALNDLLLAGGGSQQVVNSALEQFRQIVAKGKPDMQDWKSLVSAAPGQLNQLAHAMLGPTASAQDLYYALGGGKDTDEHTEGIEHASITINELLDALIELDEQGSDSFASFSEQAEDAQAGISTAMANASNAVTKGIASTIEVVGRDNIVGVINDVKGLVKDGFADFNEFLENTGDLITNFDNGAGSIDTLRSSIQLLYDDVDEYSDIDFNTDSIKLGLDRCRDAADEAKDAHTDYLEQLSKSAGVIEAAGQQYETSVSNLEYAYGVIERYGDKTGLTTTQQWLLQEAVDAVNQACGTQLQLVDPLNGKIAGEEGVYENAAEAIWDYIDAKKAEYKLDYLATTSNEFESTYAAALNEYSAAAVSVNTAWDVAQSLSQKYGSWDAFSAYAISQPTGGQRYASGGGAVVLRSDEQQLAYDTYSAFIRAGMEARAADAQLYRDAQTKDELAAQQAAYLAIKNGEDQTIASRVLTSSVAGAAFGYGGEREELSLLNFAEALETCTTDANKLNEALADEEVMSKFVAAYDGSAASLNRVFQTLRNQVGGWDSTLAAEIDKASSDLIYSWFDELDDETYALMVATGDTMDAVVKNLGDAGVSFEDLNKVGSDAISDLLISVNGDLDALAIAIKHYNEDVPLQDKDGKITVDDAQLYAANGDVAVWNDEKNTLVWKDTGVEVDISELYDAQGQVYTWNHTELKKLSTSVEINTASIDYARSKLSGLYNQVTALNSVEASLNVTSYSSESLNNVSRSFTGHAAGGIRRHAGGGIYTRPTYVTEHDQVAEDGAEAWVPFENKRYAQPFIDLVAEGVNKQGSTVINNYNLILNEEVLARYSSMDDLVWHAFEEALRIVGGNVGS